MSGILDATSDIISRFNNEPTQAERVKLQEQRLADLEKQTLYEKQKTDLPYHMQGFDPHTIPKEYWLNADEPRNTDKMRVPMYRAGTKPINTDPKTQLETLPMRDKVSESGKLLGSSGGWKQTNKATDPYLSASKLYARARDMKAAEHLGVAQLPPELLAGLALKEGSAHMGAQGHDKTQKKQEELYTKLVASGVNKENASFLTQLTNKKEMADRFKIPFGAMWNGTGKNWAGTSGADYAKELEKHIQATKHPKNKQLMDLVNMGVAHGASYPYKTKEHE